MLNLYTSTVGLLEDGLSTLQRLLQLLGLRGQHKHTDLPEEGLSQNGMRLKALEKLLRGQTKKGGEQRLREDQWKKCLKIIQCLINSIHYIVYEISHMSLDLCNTNK